jgi:hypothetical protein
MSITPRLKWLYLSKETTKPVRWHPADSEAWEALDCFDPEFARDPRSVRLGLSMDGFQPHNTDSSLYSC